MKTNKRILVGSIIAVVIFILMSFTSVVGFEKVESDSKIMSPLFGVRTNRAVNKDIPIIRGTFIGKGKEISISLPGINHLKSTEKSLYTVTCGYETAHNVCCRTMVWWACDITTGPLCQYITTGPICNWISFQQSCAHKDSSG